MGSSVAFVRAEQSLRRRCQGHSVSRRLTTDGGREMLNGNSTGSIRKRSTAADSSTATGGAPTRRAWRSFSSTRAGSRVHRRRSHPVSPTLEVTDYPKAGDPNPRVKLGIARQRRPVDLVDLDSHARPTSSSSTSAGRPIRRGRLPGPGSRADVARPESGRRATGRARRCFARRRRPG